MVSLEKRRLGANLTAGFKYLWRGNQEYEARLFIAAFGRRIKCY